MYNKGVRTTVLPSQHLGKRQSVTPPVATESPAEGQSDRTRELSRKLLQKLLPKPDVGMLPLILTVLNREYNGGVRCLYKALLC